VKSLVLIGSVAHVTGVIYRPEELSPSTERIRSNKSRRASGRESIMERVHDVFGGEENARDFEAGPACEWDKRVIDHRRIL